VDSPSHTVLVVDDDASIRFLCRLNLELEGWSVLEAASIEEARAQLPRADVVLLDVHLGSSSSLHLLDEIHVPVALLTGSVEPEGVADAVIPKPFRIEQLTQTVRELLQRSANTAG
jgi:two-component system, OmpR family, alkaline phosphatase synthesis response regulator PhoP